ncbi:MULTISPECIES: hypothetical protein [Microbacterium]|uniref:hypothetical protein n=1 Tax=Microbacterium TaxID=33882 RepID=UPI0027821C18|nr:MULTISPECIES: hypothetical protein [Microbacterium]MDQ1084312.1 putative small lipoprotein YifL [Microbacterium sp. SORGH_AS_0344]MDQ1170412.1 putative small lipoprotein YifL [Microbacterium proteolyticum]
MTDVWEISLSDARMRRVRRWTAVAAAVLSLVAVAVGVIVLSVSVRSDGLQQVIVGSWNGDGLFTASIAASAVLLAVTVIAVPGRRWWLLLLVPLRVTAVVAALLGGLGLALTDESATPIVANGCETGYVVSERAFLFAASGDVLRMDGIIGTRVDRTTVDDGHKPFQNRSYIAVADGDVVRVWHTVESVWNNLDTRDEPMMVLPRLTSATGCGLAGGAPMSPSPAPVAAGPDEGPEAVSAPSDTRERLARMAALTIDASNGTAVDAAGAPVRAPAADELPCEGATGVTLVFSTDDNDASYEAILDAWTAAGFASDRAMQEDLRSDGVVRLSARDRSTIDGMLHFDLSADCRRP